jgi:hypothetical protein
MPIAKEASTAAAMQAVFQTSELVENILVHLPAKTVFGVQRVSKSFNNAVKNSLPIKEKLFLRPRSTNVHKVIAHGFQHTAAALNTLFIPGAFSENHAVHYMPLPFRTGLHEKYGITMEQAGVMSMESSILETYLLEIPFKKLKLNLRFWVGENSPTVGVFEATVNAEKPMTIRAMIDSVLQSRQVISLAYDEDQWRGFKHDDDIPDLFNVSPDDLLPRVPDRGRWYTDYDHGRRRLRSKRVQFILPKVKWYEIMPSLKAARAAGNEAAWGRETYAKPSAVLHDLQALFGPPSQVSISLSQQPEFALHDIVVASLEHQAETVAR